MSVSCSTSVGAASTVTQTSTSSVPSLYTITGTAQTSTSTVLSAVTSCSTAASCSGLSGLLTGCTSSCATSTSTSLVTTTITGSNSVATSYVPTTIFRTSTVPGATNSVCVTAAPSTTTTSSIPTTSSTMTTSSTTSTTTSTTSSTTTSSSIPTTSSTTTSSPMTSSSGFATITSYSTLLITTIGSDGSTSVSTSAIAALQSGKNAANGTNHSSTGAIAGGTVGGVAAIVLVGVLAWFLRRKGYFKRDADEQFTDDMWAPAAHSPGAAGFGTGAAVGGAAAVGAGVRSRSGHLDDEDDSNEMMGDHSLGSGEMMSEKNFDRQQSWYSDGQHGQYPALQNGAGYYAQPTSSHGHGYPASVHGSIGLAGVGAGGAARAAHQGMHSMSSGGHDPYYGRQSPQEYYTNGGYGTYPPRAGTPGNEINSNGHYRMPSSDRLNAGSPGPLALDEAGPSLGLDFSGAHDAYGGMQEDTGISSAEHSGAVPSTTGATAMGSEATDHYPNGVEHLAGPDGRFARPQASRHISSDSFAGPSQFLGARVANADD